MQQSRPGRSRRRFLNSALGATAVVALGGLQIRAVQAGGHLPKVSEDDPTAKALRYVAQSAKDGQTCMNCQLYTGKEGKDFGPCAIFPGKEVAAKGWCSSWVKKA